jgi:hypothetical protein
MQAQTAIIQTTLSHTPNSLVQRIWPVTAVVLGLALTAVWIAFLGYGIISLMELI